MKIEQSPVPNGEMLDGLSRHIDRVGERWMTVFENQVQHEQSMARENLRVNETLNTKQLNIQESQVSGDNRRIILAQLIAGALLLLGLVFFVALVGAALWLFQSDKNLAGTVAIAIALTFGYYFRSVVSTYFPGGQGKK